MNLKSRKQLSSWLGNITVHSRWLRIPSLQRAWELRFQLDTMTTKSLLDELNKQRDALNTAIVLIEHLIATGKPVQGRASLVKSIKKYKKYRKRGTPAPKRKKAWTVKPHRWKPEQRAKFLKTMKERYDIKIKGSKDDKS